jgi:hypothetical protein
MGGVSQRAATKAGQARARMGYDCPRDCAYEQTIFPINLSLSVCVLFLSSIKERDSTLHFSDLCCRRCSVHLSTTPCFHPSSAVISLRLVILQEYHFFCLSLSDLCSEGALLFFHFLFSGLEIFVTSAFLYDRLTLRRQGVEYFVSRFTKC